MRLGPRLVRIGIHLARVRLRLTAAAWAARGPGKVRYVNDNDEQALRHS